jgi:hypothetical protein
MCLSGRNQILTCFEKTELIDVDIQMLKAIWPSLAHLHNDLPAGANITTSGMHSAALRSDSKESLIIAGHIVANRNDVLLLILADSVPAYARFASKDPLVIHRQGHHCSPCLARDAYLVVHQGGQTKAH